MITEGVLAKPFGPNVVVADGADGSKVFGLQPMFLVVLVMDTPLQPPRRVHTHLLSLSPSVYIKCHRVALVEMDLDAATMSLAETITPNVR